MRVQAQAARCIANCDKFRIACKCFFVPINLSLLKGALHNPANLAHLSSQMPPLAQADDNLGTSTNLPRRRPLRTASNLPRADRADRHCLPKTGLKGLDPGLAFSSRSTETGHTQLNKTRS